MSSSISKSYLSRSSAWVSYILQYVCTHRSRVRTLARSYDFQNYVHIRVEELIVLLIACFREHDRRGQHKVHGCPFWQGQCTQK